MVDNKTEFSLRVYKCGYCKNKFKQLIRRIEGNPPVGYKGKDATTSQVKCNRCNNFLKTDEHIEDLGIYKGKPKKRVYSMNENI